MLNLLHTRHIELSKLGQEPKSRLDSISCDCRTRLSNPISLIDSEINKERTL